MTCKHVYKRGSKKGSRCTNQSLDNSDFCKNHFKEPEQLFKVSSRAFIEETLRQKILALPTSVENKSVIMKHYYNMKRVEQNSTEYYKNQMFVEQALQYPWSNYFDMKEFIQGIDVKSFIMYVKESLDREIYGMNHVKDEIVNIVCKLITNPTSNRNNIALYGPAGVGKSKFIKVLSNVLGLPMKVISLGGIKDSSFFIGHGYVYVESGPGKILQNIIDAKVSNPIIYFDELDKISETDSGKDIYSFLSYLTDSTQNSEFTDHYFYGMKFDLSKVFYVFTFNDINKVDKVLLDRLNVIHVGAPSEEEMVHILQKYCVPDILQNTGIQHKVFFTTEQVQTVITMSKTSVDATVSSGIRESFRILEKIILSVNKDILLGKLCTEEQGTILLNDTLFGQYAH